MKPDLPLEVTYLKIGAIRPNPHNARRHSKAQMRNVAKSFREYGCINPLLIDENDLLLAGHCRREVGKFLGLKELPCIRIKGLTEAQKRAFLIADNKLTELGDWDMHQLALEIRELTAGELDFDISALGFETAEIDLLIDSLEPGDRGVAGEPEELELPLREVPVSHVDDLWQLGKHRLLCGDALKAPSYRRLMGDDRARMAITDPPYNVPVDGHVCGLGNVHHEEFAMASGEMTPAEFTRFLRTAMRNMAQVCMDGALAYVCMDWRHISELLAAAQGIFGAPRNLCVWAKTNAGMGSLYRSQHELVFVFKYGSAPHINNVALGKHGRHRSNVWTYPGVNTFGANRMEMLRLHPTVKPVALVADAIRDASHRNDLILDPFCGSGTVLIAAERTGRRARAVELEPRYIDAAVRRWQSETGRKAIHVGSGRSFDEIEEQADER